MSLRTCRKVFLLASLALVHANLNVAQNAAEPGPHFRLHEIARPGGQRFGQTSAADVDRDGDLDFISGQAFGALFWFEQQARDRRLFLENLRIAGQKHPEN